MDNDMRNADLRHADLAGVVIGDTWEVINGRLRSKA